jgi:hypothetical protein
MAGRSATRYLSLLCLCWLGHACSEAHGPSVADERDVADQQAPAQAERDTHDNHHESLEPTCAPSPASAPAGGTAGQSDVENTLAPCEARDFDPSLRPDDDGPASRCRYQVLPEGVDAQYVRVEVGDRTLWLDHTPDGWTFEVETRLVRLLGAACDEARAGARVRIQNECALVPLH